MKRAHVVFDLGGVVLHWQPVALIAAELPQHAHRAEQLTAQFFEGYGGDWAEFDRGAIAPGPLAERIAARTGLTAGEASGVIAAVPAALRPNLDTLALIDALKAAGHRLFYLSNMPAPYADALLREHAFFDRFEDGLFSSRVQVVKPDPVIFRLALHRFGVAAGDCVFLDDHPANVGAALAEGWQALHFTDAAAVRASLGV